jgi:hypothetical protein
MHVRYSDSFFATTATVTPVLLLALTLQGDFIARIFIGMIKAFAASLAAAQTSERYPRSPCSGEFSLLSIVRVHRWLLGSIRHGGRDLHPATARLRVMALAILGVLWVTACGSSSNHLTSPSDSPSSQSSQQNVWRTTHLMAFPTKEHPLGVRVTDLTQTDRR